MGNLSNVVFNSSLRPGFASFGLLLLRLAFGGSMIVGHAWAKVQSFGRLTVEFPDPLGLGPLLSFLLVLFAELVCSALIVLGAATRWAAVPLIFSMSVAVSIVHAADPFARKEMAVLYLAAFVTILFTGPGKISVDGLLSKR